MVKIYTYSRFDSILTNRFCLGLIITLIITFLGFAPVSAQQISEVEGYIAKAESANPQEAARLKSLVYDVQPTVYLNDGAFTPIGEGAMSVAQINAGDIGKLEQGHNSLRTVSLLMIRFKNREELQAFRLQPAVLGSMPNLSYVFLSLGYDAGQGENFSGIQGFDATQIVLLYESARPF